MCLQRGQGYLLVSFIFKDYQQRGAEAGPPGTLGWSGTCKPFAPKCVAVIEDIGGFCLFFLFLQILSAVWFSFSGAETMAFFMKTMISNQVKNLGFGGGSEEKKEEGGASDPAAAQGMTREEYEEYQKQMIEEK